MFIKLLLAQLAKNGKLLIAYLLVQAPWVSDYPGLFDAIRVAMDNPSNQNYINVVIQLIAAVGGGHRLWKILLAVLVAKKRL